RGAAKQPVDLRRVVTRCTTHEPGGPDLVAVHRRDITTGPGHQPRALPVMRQSMTPAGCPGALCCLRMGRLNQAFLAGVARRAPGGPPKAEPGADAGPAAPQAPP